MPIVPPNNPTDEHPFVEWRIISPGYFNALGIPLRGDDFQGDEKTQEPRVIISAEMARRFWPGKDPIGLSFQWASDSTPNVIVGVAGDVRNISLDALPEPVVYMPLATGSNWNPMILSLRSPLPASAQVAAVRRLVNEIDSSIPTFSVQTADELITVTLGDRLFRTVVIGFFAGVSLLLASLGLFSLMAYVVSQRTHEIGIRLSLGATPADVLRLIVRRGMILASAGTGIGIVAALFFSRWLKQLLFNVKPTDALAFSGGVALLISVSLLACYIPARRATRVDPLIALRHE